MCLGLANGVGTLACMLYELHCRHQSPIVAYRKGCYISPRIIRNKHRLPVSGYTDVAGMRPAGSLLIDEL